MKVTKTQVVQVSFRARMLDGFAKQLEVHSGQVFTDVNDFANVKISFIEESPTRRYNEVVIPEDAIGELIESLRAYQTQRGSI